MRRRAAELSGSSLYYYYYYAKLLDYCHVITGTSLHVTRRDAINACSLCEDIKLWPDCRLGFYVPLEGE